MHRFDEQTEVEVASAIALTRQLRGWRDLAGVPPKIVLEASGDGSLIPEFVSRLGRVRLGAEGNEPVATVAGFGILPSEGLDMDELKGRLEARRGKLETEMKKIESKLANRNFVDRAPPEVVAEERGKLEQVRLEITELG